MRQPPTFTTWKITCRSADEAQALQQWLASRIDLERIITDTVRTMPNGIEDVQTVSHRLGDYFAVIRIEPESASNPASLLLVFQRRPDAGRFWKDLMVNIVREIEARSGTAFVEMDSKRELEPAPTAPSDSLSTIYLGSEHMPDHW